MQELDLNSGHPTSLHLIVWAPATRLLDKKNDKIVELIDYANECL